jgi:copper chaperone CopZ
VLLAQTLFTIAVCAFAAGIILNIVTHSTMSVSIHKGHFMLPVWLKHISAIILLFVIASAYIKKMKNNKMRPVSETTPDYSNDVLTFNVEGINCAHCVNSIKNELSKLDNISSVNVNIEEGKVQITGSELNRTKLAEIINSLGFSVTDEKL